MVMQGVLHHFLSGAREVGIRLSYGLGLRCQGCMDVLSSSDAGPLCKSCRALLAPRLGGYCPRCGDCYCDATAPVYECAACRVLPPRWTNFYFWGPYEGGIKSVIHRHKFGADHGSERLLGYLIDQVCQLRISLMPDCVVPVPMRFGRLLRRGFNQSAVLARLLARRLDRPLIIEGLHKMRATASQSSLGRFARLRNVQGAFRGSPALDGKHVLLVDDVMTTGATLTSCTEACFGAGAERVDVLVLARALRR